MWFEHMLHFSAYLLIDTKFRPKFYQVLAYCLFNYNVNPAIALSWRRGAVASNDPHISRGLLLGFNR